MNVETRVETGRNRSCAGSRKVLKGKGRPLAGTGRQTGLKIRRLSPQNQHPELKRMAGHSVNVWGILKRRIEPARPYFGEQRSPAKVLTFGQKRPVSTAHVHGMDRVSRFAQVQRNKRELSFTSTRAPARRDYAPAPPPRPDLSARR